MLLCISEVRHSNDASTNYRGDIHHYQVGKWVELQHGYLGNRREEVGGEGVYDSMSTQEVLVVTTLKK